jgi:hypothetical protein
MRTEKLILIVAVAGCAAGLLLPSPVFPVEPSQTRPPTIGVDVELPRQLGPFHQGEPKAPPVRCDASAAALAFCRSTALT